MWSLSFAVQSAIAISQASKARVADDSVLFESRVIQYRPVVTSR